MSKKNFDDLLSNKFEEEDFEYNPQHWKNLSKQLTQNKVENRRSKIWSISLGIAAAMALVLSSVLLIRFVQTNETLPNEPLAISNPIITSPKSSLNTEEDQQQKEAFSKPGKKESVRNVIAKNHEEKNAGKNTVVNSVSPVESSQSNFKDESSPKEPQIVEKSTIKVAAKTKENNNPTRMPRDNSFVLDNYMENAEKGSKTSVAIGGGINYSSLNAGYSLGLSAKQKVGKKFFVDGSIAVLYNNNASNVGSYAGKPARSSSTTLITQSSPAFSSWDNLFYMQVNPSIGYQVTELVGISFGGDLQQLLSSENNIDKIKFTDDGVKLFPTMDLGITGKAEFDLGQNIQTGILFREGINNLFNEQALPYVNRRYIQVQFKYNIPIK